MKFGTKVMVERGGIMNHRFVRGVLVGARGLIRFVRLSQDDPGDTVGWNKKGQIGHWAKSQVIALRDYYTDVAI